MSKMNGAFKIVTGVAQGAQGVMTSLGHGLLGAYLRNHHMGPTAARYGQAKIKEAERKIKEGVEEWKRG
jgi:hypothetical protein